MMKLFPLFFLSLIAIAAANETGHVMRVSASILLEGVRHTNGTVRVGLFHREGFPQDSARVIAGAVIPAGQAQLPVQLPGVEPGIYAILVYHDENGNGRLDYDWIGRPREGYGVSNNARHIHRAPHFDESSVLIDPAHSLFRIRVRY